MFYLLLTLAIISIYASQVSLGIVGTRWLWAGRLTKCRCDRMRLPISIMQSIKSFVPGDNMNHLDKQCKLSFPFYLNGQSYISYEELVETYCAMDEQCDAIELI